jgi:hypothetical protein
MDVKLGRSLNGSKTVKVTYVILNFKFCMLQAEVMAYTAQASHHQYHSHTRSSMLQEIQKLDNTSSTQDLINNSCLFIFKELE